jgi:CheY-like chemotaxis protein
VLSEQGHEVVEAANGTEALDALRRRDRDYDLLISDYAMPHLSGAEFVREARDLCPGVPALIITGYAEARAVSGRPEGVEILLKPFTEAALEAAIERACRPAFVPG